MIPENIQAVTPEWMSEVLGVQVGISSVEQIGQGVGIMGDIFRAHLTSEVNAPASVVVKLPSSFEENRSQGVALGMFEAEVKFYNELADQVTVGLPEVYHADIQSGSADFVIVMEDLSDLTLVQQAVGMSATQAHNAVRVLANVHAVWWNKAKAQELEWIPTMIGPRIEMVDQLLLQILPVFLEGFGHALSDDARQVYERFAGNYLNINKVIAARSPWTLVHQDFRVENLMFGSDESARVVVLDWQGIGRGPGAYDLAYILSGSMQPEVRREHEEALLTTYLEQLQSLGVADYAFDQLQEDYAHAQLMGGLATAMVTGGGMDLSNERGKELITTMAVRHATAALDHDGLRRLAEISGASS